MSLLVQNEHYECRKHWMHLCTRSTQNFLDIILLSEDIVA